MKYIVIFLLTLGVVFTNISYGHSIAVTIDDLPFVGINSYDERDPTHTQTRFKTILQTLIQYHVPATGFVIAGSIGRGQWQLLEEFRQEGFALGNHTYTHANLNKLSASKYIDEIDKADKKLAQIMTQPKYFRFPYLAEGAGEKRHKIQDYLVANQYIVAPVTIDSGDYRFNGRLLKIPERSRPAYLEKIKNEYLSYLWKQTLRAERISKQENSKQILLIHANLLNSYFLGDILQMYQNKGYSFITLDEALSGTPNIISAMDKNTRIMHNDAPHEQHEASSAEPIEFEHVWQ